MEGSKRTVHRDTHALAAHLQNGLGWVYQDVLTAICVKFLSHGFLASSNELALRVGVEIVVIDDGYIQRVI